MTLFFCISDILDEIEKIDDPRTRFSSLAAVYRVPPECGGHPEDVFIVENLQKLIDFSKDDAAEKLTDLIDKVPLYQFNIELLLDKALAEKGKNPSLAQALEKAFGTGALPGAVPKARDASGDFAPGLTHPALGHFDRADLCRIYTAFLREIGEELSAYGFEKGVLGKHAERFAQHVSGFIGESAGKAVAETIIGFGARKDHDSTRAIESYVGAGEKKARDMNLTDPTETIWAWLEAENFQMRRCRDIDRLLKAGRLKKQPNWIKSDLFCFLEKEAMKQVFAQNLFKSANLPPLLETMPRLRRALEINAQSHVDEFLQQLITQIMSPESVYSGAAGKFADSAAQRRREAQAQNWV